MVRNISSPDIALQAISFDDILHAMGRNSRKRHAASEAVISLREVLGLTQQTLAHEMKTAIVTIARWETSGPPRGETLLRLAKFANQQAIGTDGPTLGTALGEIEGVFMSLYLDEVLANVGGETLARYKMLPNFKTGVTYLLMKLEGKEGYDFAMNCLLNAPAGTK